MNKILKLFMSMLKIGVIGFGGGNALIPVIEKTAIDEQKLITKDEYDIDVMVASITPGALPVEISGGIGRRIMGSYGLLLGAIAMALPGAVFTVSLTSLMSNVNDAFLRQVGFLAIGIYAFICCLLIDYIRGSTRNFNDKASRIRCVCVIIGVIVLVCGKNVFRLLPGGLSSLLSLSTIQVFAMSFFTIFYTRCRFNVKNVLVTALCCIVFVLCHCKAEVITNDIVRYADYVVMMCLSVYGLVCDFKKGCKIDKEASFKNSIKEVLFCVFFVILFSVPALILSGRTISFVAHGLLSSIMSFGGGDAYLTVADGMFVSTGMITEEEFYSMLVPLVNVLPGSILCKALSGVGYYIGYNETSSTLGGICVALSGFAVSVAASCGVFSIVAGIYDKFGTLNIFQLIKRWIRPIVSGLLVNVILSLLVQVKNQGKEFDSVLMPVICVVFLFVVDEILMKKFKLKNEIVVVISTVASVVICNLLQVV